MIVLLMYALWWETRLHLADHLTRVHLVSSMVSSLDVQRLFLQSAISRRVLSAELAKVIWKQCVEAVKGLFIVLSHLFPTQRRATQQLQITTSK